MLRQREPRARVPATQILRESGVGVVIATAFVVMLGYGIVAPILPLYARSFGVGYGAAGLLISVWGFARLVTDLFAGPLVDRYGEHRMAAAGVGVLAVSAVLTGLAPNFALAVLFRAIGGAGSSVMFAAMYSYLLKAVPRDRMARTLGIFYGAFNIGLIAGGPAGGLIAHAWGLAAPLFFYGGLQAVSGILFLRFVPPVRSDAPAAPESEAATRFPSLSRIRILLRDRAFIATLVLNLAYAWMIAGIYDTLIPLYGRDGLGMSTVAIGAAFAVALLTELLVLYPAGSLADRLGRKPVVVPSMAGLAVVTVVLGWAGTPAIYFVLLAVLGVASGVAGVIPTAMLSDVAPAGAKGTAVGLYRFCGDIGFTFGPLVAGATTGLLTFKAAFAVAALPTVLALAFLLATPETLTRREPEPAIPPPSPPA